MTPKRTRGLDLSPKPSSSFKLTPPKKQAFVPIEWDEQIAVFDYAKAAAKQDWRWNLLFATLNGLRLTIGQAVKAKAGGMKKGVPDIWLPVRTKLYVGRVVELKRIKGGVLEDEQEWWLNALTEQGWHASRENGAKAAIKAFQAHLNWKLWEQ